MVKIKPNSSNQKDLLELKSVWITSKMTAEEIEELFTKKNSQIRAYLANIAPRENISSEETGKLKMPFLDGKLRKAVESYLMLAFKSETLPEVDLNLLSKSFSKYQSWASDISRISKPLKKAVLKGDVPQVFPAQHSYFKIPEGKNWADRRLKLRNREKIPQPVEPINLLDDRGRNFWANRLNHCFISPELDNVLVNYSEDNVNDLKTGAQVFAQKYQETQNDLFQNLQISLTVQALYLERILSGAQNYIPEKKLKILEAEAVALLDIFSSKPFSSEELNSLLDWFNQSPQNSPLRSIESQSLFKQKVWGENPSLPFSSEARSNLLKEDRFGNTILDLLFSLLMKEREAVYSDLDPLGQTETAESINQAASVLLERFPPEDRDRISILNLRLDKRLIIQQVEQKVLGWEKPFDVRSPESLQKLEELQAEKLKIQRSLLELQEKTRKALPDIEASRKDFEFKNRIYYLMNFVPRLLIECHFRNDWVFCIEPKNAKKSEPVPNLNHLPEHFEMVQLYSYSSWYRWSKPLVDSGSHVTKSEPFFPGNPFKNGYAKHLLSIIEKGALLDHLNKELVSPWSKTTIFRIYKEVRGESQSDIQKIFEEIIKAYELKIKEDSLDWFWTQELITTMKELIPIVDDSRKVSDLLLTEAKPVSDSQKTETQKKISEFWLNFTHKDELISSLPQGLSLKELDSKLSEYLKNYSFMQSNVNRAKLFRLVESAKSWKMADKLLSWFYDQSEDILKETLNYQSNISESFIDQRNNSENSSEASSEDEIIGQENCSKDETIGQEFINIYGQLKDFLFAVFLLQDKNQTREVLKSIMPYELVFGHRTFVEAVFKGRSLPKTPFKSLESDLKGKPFEIIMRLIEKEPFQRSLQLKNHIQEEMPEFVEKVDLWNRLIQNESISEQLLEMKSSYRLKEVDPLLLKKLNLFRESQRKHHKENAEPYYHCNI